MAVEIKSGASVDLLTIHPTSKAGRVTLYDDSGTSLLPNNTWRGFYAVSVRQTATTASGSIVWALHNPSASKTLQIKSLYLRAFFDGTAAATNLKYDVSKATTVTSFTGGSVVTPLNKVTALGAANGVGRVGDTGLTATGATWGGAMTTIVQGRVTQTTTNFSSMSEEYHFMGDLQVGEIELAQNEILAIRITAAAAVIGDNLIGTIEVSEK
jgi:hypothetical protein